VAWAELMAKMGAVRNAYNILTGKPEEKGPLGRTTRRTEDSFTICLRSSLKEPALLLGLHRVLSILCNF